MITEAPHIAQLSPISVCLLESALPVQRPKGTLPQQATPPSINSETSSVPGDAPTPSRFQNYNRVILCAASSLLLDLRCCCSCYSFFRCGAP